MFFYKKQKKTFVVILSPLWPFAERQSIFIPNHKFTIPHHSSMSQRKVSELQISTNVLSALTIIWIRVGVIVCGIGVIFVYILER